MTPDGQYVAGRAEERLGKAWQKPRLLRPSRSTIHIYTFSGAEGDG
jgi:hypothetical protein